MPKKLTQWFEIHVRSQVAHDQATVFSPEELTVTMCCIAAYSTRFALELGATSKSPHSPPPILGNLQLVVSYSY